MNSVIRKNFFTWQNMSNFLSMFQRWRLKRKIQTSIHLVQLILSKNWKTIILPSTQPQCLKLSAVAKANNIASNVTARVRRKRIFGFAMFTLTFSTLSFVLCLMLMSMKKKQLSPNSFISFLFNQSFFTTLLRQKMSNCHAICTTDTKLTSSYNLSLLV